jgi:hypothetical protein
MIKQYKVGGHAYRITFADNGVNDDRLLQSSKPFETPLDDSPLLFEMFVDDSFRPKETGKEIGQFDSGGNNNGVYIREDGSYEIRLSDYMKRQCCLMDATHDFSTIRIALNGDLSMRRFGINNALMMTMAFAAADKDTVLIHASVVRENGYGYPFLGVSGTGKSTHTSNWLKYIPGTDLMNDDNPVIRIVDGTPVVFGSPWSGKTPCYRNVQAPIGAITQLKQAPYNKIRRETVVEAFASILPSCSIMKWDQRIYSGICDTVTKIIETVPTYFLENLPNEEAVRLSFNTIRR